MKHKPIGSLSSREPLKGVLSRNEKITINPNIEPLTVTENGEYKAPENIHGYNPVNVNVPSRYDEGYTEGYNKGNTDGYQQGNLDGYNSGYENGYQASQDSITLQEKTTTKNGTVTADDGYTGLSKVNVEVPERYDEGYTAGKEDGYDEGYQKGFDDNKPVVEPLEVTENGTYTPSGDVDGYNSVFVNVPIRYEEGYNKGFSEGKEEGYSEGYQASQDSITLQEKFITENGEFVTDEGFTGMKKVIVAVPIKEEQTKTVEITKNGTTEVVADEGKTMSKVTVNTNVAFEGDIGKPYIDTSKMTNFSNFFNHGSRLELLELIDTCNGTNFENMFISCETLKKIPFFDFSKGTNFSQIFYGCLELEQLPPLDFSKGTDFSYAFSWCATLTEIPLVDISKATNLNSTFEGCMSLVTLALTTAKTDFDTMSFNECPELTNLTIGENWKTSIYLNYSPKLSTKSLHGMIENLADLTGKKSKKFQIGATNLAKVDEAHINMLQAKNWNYS